MPAQPLPSILQALPPLAAASHVLLLIDFDGTLVPIKERPEECILSNEVRATLTSLAALPSCTVAIISGRELKDLEARVQLADIHYAGNHGLEIKTGQELFVQPVALSLREPLDTMAKELSHELTGIPGAWLQHKQLTLSIHYRQVDASNQQQVINLVKDIIRAHSKNGEFELRHGKKVVEIRPAVSWNKGTTTKWLHQHLRMPADTRIIYIGDDLTDEDAFIAWPDQITVHVGSTATTHARYQVPDTDSVHRLLLELYAYWQHHTLC